MRLLLLQKRFYPHRQSKPILLFFGLDFCFHVTSLPAAGAHLLDIAECREEMPEMGVQLLLPFRGEGIPLSFVHAEQAFGPELLQGGINRARARLVALPLPQLPGELRSGHLLPAEQPHHQEGQESPHLAERHGDIILLHL